MSKSVSRVEEEIQQRTHMYIHMYVKWTTTGLDVSRSCKTFGVNLVRFDVACQQNYLARNPSIRYKRRRIREKGRGSDERMARGIAQLFALFALFVRTYKVRADSIVRKQCRHKYPGDFEITVNWVGKTRHVAFERDTNVSVRSSSRWVEIVALSCPFYPAVLFSIEEQRNASSTQLYFGFFSRQVSKYMALGSNIDEQRWLRRPMIHIWKLPISPTRGMHFYSII